MVKKGELTLQKDIKQGSTSSKDKSKYVSKNWEVVHDGFVDNITSKPTKETFNLTDNLKESKNLRNLLLIKRHLEWNQGNHGLHVLNESIHL